MQKWIVTTALSLSSVFFGDAAPIQPYAPPAPPTPPPTPWLMGPLIAPIGQVIPYGDFEIESYVYFATDTGAYNSHWGVVPASNNFFSFSPQFQCYFGLTPWMDLFILPQFSYNTTNGQHAVNFGDFPVTLDFQLLAPGTTPYFPGIKFTAAMTFPTGNFQRLDPNKLLTDQSGAGSFSSTFGLVLYNQYHLWGPHFLSTTYSAAYTITSPVHVHGFNTYGGGYGTNGKALPGNIFEGIISFELSLTQNWALAVDNVYIHVDGTQFYGNPGLTASGDVASVGGPSSEQFSFSPAIEYNFSANLGIEVGCWFTAWGRNSTQFRTAVVEVAYTY